MLKELIAINLATCRRITLRGVLCERADKESVSRSDLPVPLTETDSEQPTFNDIASAAMALNCRVEIMELRFMPRENDTYV